MGFYKEQLTAEEENARLWLIGIFFGLSRAIGGKEKTLAMIELAIEGFKTTEFPKKE